MDSPMVTFFRQVVARVDQTLFPEVPTPLFTLDRKYFVYSQDSSLLYFGSKGELLDLTHNQDEAAHIPEGTNLFILCVQDLDQRMNENTFLVGWDVDHIVWHWTVLAEWLKVLAYRFQPIATFTGRVLIQCLFLTNEDLRACLSDARPEVYEIWLAQRKTRTRKVWQESKSRLIESAQRKNPGCTRRESMPIAQLLCWQKVEAEVIGDVVNAVRMHKGEEQALRFLYQAKQRGEQKIASIVN